MTKTWVRPGAEGDAIGEDVPAKEPRKSLVRFSPQGTVGTVTRVGSHTRGWVETARRRLGEEEMAQDVEQ